MKIRYGTIIIISLLFALSCSTQNQKVNNEQQTQSKKETSKYDIDFPKYVEAKWKNIFFEKENLSKFDFLKSFDKQLKVKDESILSKKFMSKPSFDNLLAHYLNRKLGWNSFNFGSREKTAREVIGEELETLPSEEEMLAFYYSTIFIHILNNQRNISPFEIDLNFDELELNETEGAIMFLSAMRHLGNQVTSYSEKPENCFRSMEFVKKIPKFNGLTFDKFQLPEFEDFKLTVDKRFPKSSFKERYIPEFMNAKKGYEKCVKRENKN